jgi:hypothetical protein
MENNKVKNSDLPAFACVAMTDATGYSQEGLTKREEFARSAMQAILSNIKLQLALIADMHLYSN